MPEVTAGTQAVGEGHGPSSCINDVTLPIASQLLLCLYKRQKHNCFGESMVGSL
jgi:hypothetical protein